MITITSFAYCFVCKKQTEHLNIYKKDTGKNGNTYSYLLKQVCVNCLPPDKKIGISLAVLLLEKEINNL